jgi:hypothetical protein
MASSHSPYEFLPDEFIPRLQAAFGAIPGAAEWFAVGKVDEAVRQLTLGGYGLTAYELDLFMPYEFSV